MPARVFSGSEPRPAAGDVRYAELFRAPALSLGWYTLAAGAVDRQRPHGEDEIYYVTRGRGRVRLGAEDHAIAPGTIVYVPARVEHRFHSISEDLTLLVAFAPAEGTAPGSAC